MKVFERRTLDLVDLPKDKEAKLLEFLHAEDLGTHRLRVKDIRTLCSAFERRTKDQGGMSYGASASKAYPKIAKGLRELKSCFLVKKTIKYRYERRYWGSTLRKIIENNDTGLVLREWKDWVIPLYPDFTFEKVDDGLEKFLEREAAEKELIKKWKLLEKECSFLYAGHQRGLYEQHDSARMRSDTGFCLKKGDVVMVIDHKIRAVKAPARYVRWLDLYTYDFKKWMFENLDEPTSTGQFSHDIAFLSGSHFLMVTGTLIPMSVEVTKENTHISGTIQVLASGTHGWLKISSKTLAKFEEDFLVEGTPEYEALNAWRAEKEAEEAAQSID